MKKQVIAELKQLYKQDKKLAVKAAKALGLKIIDNKKEEKQRVISELGTLYKKDQQLAIKVAKVLGYKIEAKGQSSLPRGWSLESVKKFWGSLTGDEKHKISQCIGKMKGKISNPGAFCGSLAKKVAYQPKLKKGQKGPWWLTKK